jgi:hypothetical protein
MSNPITPPPELVQQWVGDYYGCPVSGELAGVETAIATRAAQWGSNQELEACLVEIRDGAGRIYIDETRLRVLLAEDIWTARRPKPPSLKEQGLDALESLQRLTTDPNIIEPLRRALEQLDD